MSELANLLPERKPSSDGIYPRCVWCGGEIYGPAVTDYSIGKIGCGSVNGCGKKVPRSYINKDLEAKYVSTMES